MSRTEDEYVEAGVRPGPGGVGEKGQTASQRRRMDAGRRKGSERTQPVTSASEESVRAAEKRVARLDDKDVSETVTLSPMTVARMTRSAPGVARVAAEAALNTATWSFRTYLKLARRLLRAATSPEEAQLLAHELGVTVGTIGELGKQLATGMSLQQAIIELTAPDREDVNGRSTAELQRQVREEDLRRKGQALLARSRDVWSNQTAHPAYARILDELAPDEARILLLMCKEGPQPSVDVRTGGPVGMVSSELLAPGLNMIGPRAGVRYEDFVPSYLNNLYRLGMVWFSREALRSPKPYQVLEAQPDVLEAMKSVKFAKVVRRSIHLTPFGHDFCVSVLAPEAAAKGDIPEHQTPAGAVSPDGGT